MVTAEDPRNEFVYERFTQPDEERSPNDPVRRGSYDPCCCEHRPGRVCLLPEGHEKGAR